MIRINLLDQASMKKGARPAKAGSANRAAAATPRSSGGSALITLAILAMLALNGGFGWMAWNQFNLARKQYESVKGEFDSTKSEINKKLKEAEQVKRYREVLANQMDVLRSLDPTDRILWSEKINMLSNLIPPNVFIAEVNIKEDVKMVETQASKEAREKWAKTKDKTKAKEPPVVTKPVISYTMRLTGLALGKDNVDQFNNVLEFHKAMTEYKLAAQGGEPHRFMDGFNENIEFESVEATLYEGTPVNKFIFKLTTRPMGEDAPGAAPDAGGAKGSQPQVAQSIKSRKQQVQDIASK